MHYYLLDFNPLLPTGWHISRIFINCFENQKGTPAGFQKNSVQIRECINQWPEGRQ
jgi:hypothetical protein